MGKQVVDSGSWLLSTTAPGKVFNELAQRKLGRIKDPRANQYSRLNVRDNEIEKRVFKGRAKKGNWIEAGNSCNKL